MPRALVLYQYLHPDDVVSAVHLSDLCRGLVARGWEVEALPSNRACRDDCAAYAAEETWQGVRIRRVWRPRLRMVPRGFARLPSAAWMIAAWMLAALRPRPPDVLIIGTDPVMAVLAAIAWKVLRPRVRIAHWCFDLYPDCAVADGLLRPGGLAARALAWLARRAYGACDLLVDIGPCMRERLAASGCHAGGAAAGVQAGRSHRRGARHVTLTPWALAESASPAAADATERHRLFGDARLGLLYSGNFGRAHGHDLLLGLARRLRGDGVRVAFSVRGNRVETLRQAVSAADTNVTFAPFAAPDALEARLGAADVHLVSLRPEWTGAVVPSKFFGSLAAGRPVVFAGDRRSAIARWIAAHGVGWVLTPETLEAVAADLRKLAADPASPGQSPASPGRSPARLGRLKRRCHEVYAQHFARERILDRWDAVLRSMLPPAAAARRVRPQRRTPARGRPCEKDSPFRFPEGPEEPALSNAKGCSAETTPGVFFAAAPPDPVRDLVGRAGWDRYYAAGPWRLPAYADEALHPHRARLIRRFLPCGPGKRLLEVGSAPGRYLAWFAREFGYEVAGIDYSPGGHEATLRNMELTGTRAEVILGDFFAYPFAPTSFDVVLSTGFVEHFDDRRRVLSRMDELLRPGGWLLATWPNLRGLNGWIFRRFRPKAAAGHFSFGAAEVAAVLRERGYAICYAGPLDGPFLLDPTAEAAWTGRHPDLARLTRAPLAVFNRCSRGLNRLLGWMPESDLLSCDQGVLAHKGP
jgi:SAM-dependent methyltransferase/glycosyltransferase involved in cell wall biosynthesis